MSTENMKKVITILLLGLMTWSITALYADDINFPEIGDSAGALISPQQEFQIGQAFFWQMQQATDLIEDPEVNSYIQSLGYRLVSHSDAPYLRFTFFMIPDSSVNAFAAPGGFIGLHTGLILTTETEDELSSVVAHEIAHITQRHLLRSYEKASQRSFPMMMAMIGAALLGAVDGQAGLAAMAAVQAGGTQIQIDVTRANEKEADNIGMQTLVRSGFDAEAMPDFFERLQYASRFYTGSAVPEFLRTHPVTTSRIAEARGRVSAYPVRRQLSDPLQFYLMRERVRVLTTADMKELVRFYAGELTTGNSENEIATRYGYSLALTESGEYYKAREILQSLIDHDDDRLTYQLALANLEIEVGNLSTALQIYQEEQKLYPDDQALTLEQVKALLLAHLPEQAEQLLLRQLDLGTSPQQLYKLLAQATRDMGKRSQSHVWLAEYYYSAGHLGFAVDQLRLATEFAKGDEYQLAKINSKLRNVEITLAQIRELEQQ